MPDRRLILLFFFLVLSLNSFCIFRYVQGNASPKSKSPGINEELLQTGDIVLRQGKGIVSGWFTRMSQHDPCFSHAGIILRRGGSVRVISCTQDCIKPGIIAQETGEFLTTATTAKFGVFRMSFSQEERRLLGEMLEHDILHPLPFDSKFELGTDSAYYCTEYIFRRMNSITPGKLSHISVSGSWKYIAPEDLYLYSKGRFILSGVLQ